ncbi:Holliday junction resolvase RecU [Terrisporobacter sp.]|uniref:Holliday junction resolvase RecU n=1 Tax=Terrisporobacter sp. TaxID=1965305 RepID=UPI00289EDA4A|nr:Holliday junction resolvase RecU [Terrisporobacter sp.]
MGNTSNKIGGNFEKKLNSVFEKYRKENKAYIIKIHTKATPIRDKHGRVIKVLYSEKSDCLDFIGLLPNAKPIIFEAKTADGRTSFPLSNIKDYQFELFDEIYNYTDNIFYIIELRHHNEVYLVHANEVKKFKENNDRKSIPYDEFKNIGILMNDLDVLKYISKDKI